MGVCPSKRDAGVIVPAGLKGLFPRPGGATNGVRTRLERQVQDSQRHGLGRVCYWLLELHLVSGMAI